MSQTETDHSSYLGNGPLTLAFLEGRDSALGMLAEIIENCPGISKTARDELCQRAVAHSAQIIGQEHWKKAMLTLPRPGTHERYDEALRESAVTDNISEARWKQFVDNDESATCLLIDTLAPYAGQGLMIANYHLHRVLSRIIHSLGDEEFSKRMLMSQTSEKESYQRAIEACKGSLKPTWRPHAKQ